MYICPACMERCQGSKQEGAVCNSCATFTPECVNHCDDAQCFMVDDCGTCIREPVKKDKDAARLSAVKKENKG